MKNKYEFSEDGSHCRIYFRDGSFFVIDEEDFKEVSRYSWALGKRGYPIAHTSRRDPNGYKTFSLHRLIMNPGDTEDVDHISGDKLDNRKSNLRICSHQENMFNQKLRETNTTGYYGVSKMKSCGKYEAYIHIDGRKKYLGLFETAEGAALARDSAAIRLFGDFARLNRDLMEVGA